MGLETNVDGCALAFEGGGYRAGYTAGMVDVLLEHRIYFPFACGISAGASNVVNYLSRDRFRTRWAFVDLAGMREAGGHASWRAGNGYINADFCYRGVIERGIVPFDWQTFRENPADFAIEAFERESGNTAVWGRKDVGDIFDLVDYVRASSTLPWLMNPIVLGGQTMFDGGLGTGAGLPVHLAEEAGYERFLFLATRPKGYRKKSFPAPVRRAVSALASDHPLFVEAILTRPERYNAELDRIEELARAGSCLIVYPDEMSVESTTFDVSRLAASFEAGRAQALRELPRWREFLFGSASAGPHAGRVAAHPLSGSPRYIDLTL